MRRCGGLSSAEAAFRPTGAGEHEGAEHLWHARPSRSFAHGGAGEASEKSIGVDYGSSIAGENP